MVRRADVAYTRGEQERAVAAGMVGAPRLWHTERVRDMPTDDTALLQAIWTQMAAMDRTLNAKIDALGKRVDDLDDKLTGRIDKLELRLEDRFDRFAAQVRRNFERVDLRLVVIDGRLDDLDDRLIRVEEHLGLAPTPR
jgi:hypothetical protein